jgi:Holliday junction DNA helicase RuvA
MALQRVKGVGGKTAQRIILELKGKLTASTNKEGALPSTHNTVTDDALIALVNLGISKSAAEAAIKKIDAPQTLTVENLIKQVLRTL